MSCEEGFLKVYVRGEPLYANDKLSCIVVISCQILSYALSVITCIDFPVPFGHSCLR